MSILGGILDERLVYTTQSYFIMGFYVWNLAGFVAVNSGLGYLQHKRSAGVEKAHELQNDSSRESMLAAKAVNWQFKRRFLPVYLLIFGSDWLQVRFRQLDLKTLCLELIFGIGTIYLYYVQR